jgi:hypothetical protein
MNIILSSPSDTPSTSPGRAYDLHPHDLPPHVVARFHGRYDTPSPDACWIWQGAKLPDGYGLVTVGTAPNRLRLLAHRIAWVVATGEPLVGDMTVDHLCFQPSCLNPRHLQAIPRTENARQARRASGGEVLPVPRKPCPDCGRSYPTRGMARHRRRIHGGA